ncbi:hypothetical protein TREMEDRAFT_57800, partial [Tremella mesenterica DSM 1558]|uniref:uncharacterized protein n=1 Tax=Tremella mesenterica (strain ATCC 24925 / CBS 8224 / DSM 1558 / NBRC 9311 / NRRL Y-6157 / RJB 2259-6 / UBC 559-6) TaxID=578456 RepID=UPI00032D3D82
MTTVVTDQEGSSFDNPSTSSSSSSEALSPTKSTIPPALTSTISSDSATPSVFSSSTISSLGGSDSTSTTNPSSHTVSPSVSSSTYVISDSSPTQTSQLKDPQQATTHPIRSIRTNSTILCIPLSITLDALCHAKRYHDLRKVWQQTFDAGFGLDAANWNHYAVALARMGDVERAFKVVQDVLLVRWDEINSRRERAL